MQTLDRHTFPSGGWQFYQPQTGWAAPAPIANTFDQQVTNIIKHRQANPAIVAKNNLSLDRDVVATELENFTRARLGMPQANAVPFAKPPRPMPQAAGEAVAGVKKFAAGAALLMEWQESGQPPVPGELSHPRAKICEDCPKNDPNGMGRFFTAPVAKMVREKLAKLHEMNLSTPSDEKLHVCAACLCPLRLKVHTPINLIAKHTKPNVLAELDPKCWILSEMK